MNTRFKAETLIHFAEDLMQQAGLDADKAQAVAEILVEGDLMGHDTHGLNLLGPYLNEITNNTMTRDGSSARYLTHSTFAKPFCSWNGTGSSPRGDGPM